MPICNVCQFQFDTEEHVLDHMSKRHPQQYQYYLEGMKDEEDILQDKQTLQAFMQSLQQITEELGINYYYGSTTDGEPSFFWKGRFKAYIDLPDKWTFIEMEDA